MSLLRWDEEDADADVVGSDDLAVRLDHRRMRRN
jgi:hypothetical protein